MPPTRVEAALTLAEQTLERFELADTTLSSLVLRCLRLARLLGNEEVRNWLFCELRGYGDDLVAEYPDWEKYATWSGREARRDENGRRFYHSWPIETVETSLELARHELSATEMPGTIPEPERTTYMQSALGATAYERVKVQTDAKRAATEQEIRRYAQIITSLRATLYSWLAGVHVELRYGAIVEDVFRRTKQRFDTFLMDRAPEAARALAAASARAASSEAEDWSQALTSCRRALKALADRLYPPTDEQPGGRDLGEESYKNRLIQFAAERLSSGLEADLASAEIDWVAKRADALYALGSKGVHGEVDSRELEITIVHTYLLAGELLSLLPEENAEASHLGTGGGNRDPKEPPPPPPSDRDTKIRQGDEPRPPRPPPDRPPPREPPPESADSTDSQGG